MTMFLQKFDRKPPFSEQGFLKDTKYFQNLYAQLSAKARLYIDEDLDFYVNTFGLGGNNPDWRTYDDILEKGVSKTDLKKTELFTSGHSRLDTSLLTQLSDQAILKRLSFVTDHGPSNFLAFEHKVIAIDLALNGFVLGVDDLLNDVYIGFSSSLGFYDPNDSRLMIEVAKSLLNLAKV